MPRGLLSVRLLSSSDVAVPHPDKKSVIMYVTSLFRVLPQSVSMEAIKEVETLPRATAAATAAAASVTRVTTEEHYEIQTQQRFSQQVGLTPIWLPREVRRGSSAFVVFRNSDHPEPFSPQSCFLMHEALITVVLR